MGTDCRVPIAWIAAAAIALVLMAIGVGLGILPGSKPASPERRAGHAKPVLVKLHREVEAYTRANGTLPSSFAFVSDEVFSWPMPYERDDFEVRVAMDPGGRLTGSIIAHGNEKVPDIAYFLEDGRFELNWSLDGPARARD